MAYLKNPTNQEGEVLMKISTTTSTNVFLARFDAVKVGATLLLPDTEHPNRVLPWTVNGGDFVGVDRKQVMLILERPSGEVRDLIGLREDLVTILDHRTHDG